MREVAIYKEKENIFGNNFLWISLEDQKLEPVFWWRTFCGTTVLSKIVLEILNNCATTVATELLFLLYSCLHNKKRNRLENRKASYLIDIYNNLKSLRWWYTTLAISTQLVQHLIIFFVYWNFKIKLYAKFQYIIGS